MTIDTNADCAFDLIIFDCDGVLVDSELLASHVLSEVLAKYDADVPPRECRERFTGSSLKRVKELVFKSAGIELPDDFEQQVRKADRDVFEQRLAPVSGMEEVLELIKLPVCVASSGSIEKITHSLELTKMIDHFKPNLFSAEMVMRGKPAPDLFLHAAKEMGVSPDRCLVIEDSPVGIKGAQKAGMTVFGFAGASHAGPGYAEMLELAGADMVFREMFALSNMVQFYQK
ncbi:HAD family hydrolase [Terasakiella sp. A23]|uniref:HAD family hydrolase n=1 Tax=Terasakiella sp. FCG-A23 TaxID=3080561 RepID=UPI00295379E0|nr:HAD family hydrolase [Terasakiella sp. A23]MDV7338113.1 HAD family hydrolase [Terasakiella sp. A23]